MRDQIIAKFKAKFPAVSLSNKRLDAIADRLATKITDENEIDTKLDELNDLHPFADIQKSDDQIADLKSKLKQKPDQSSSNQQQDKADDKSTDNEPPEWAKGMMSELAEFRREKTAGAVKDKVFAHEKLKNVPKSYYDKWALPESEEGINAFVENVETGYKSFRQELGGQGVIIPEKPVAGSQTTDGKVSGMMTTYLENKKAKADKT